MMTRLVLSLALLVVVFTVSWAASQPQPETKPPSPAQPPAPVSPRPEAVSQPPAQPPAATNQPAELPAPQSYVGSNACYICHRRQSDTWSETKHAQEFARLPEHYRQDASCLKCHVTGFAEPEGYVAGTEKDLLAVGCEACHGPGQRHIEAAKRFVLATPEEEAKLEKEMRITVIKTPADSLCIKCHLTQAHQNHPYFHGHSADQVAGQTASRPAHSYALLRATSTPTWHTSRYGLQTCGSCHYARYKQSITESHSALSATLPPKYFHDQECGKCHPKANVAVNNSPDAANLHHNRIGAYCESCHGPGLEHVQFNRQFISGPPLGPTLEQAARLTIRHGKSATACVSCHVGENHQPHPEFTK